MATIKIETGIPIPKTTRGGKGDARLNMVKDLLDALNEKGQSFLLPMENAEVAAEERRHYLNRANKYGKLPNVRKEFVVQAVEGHGPIAADPKTKTKAQEAQPAGLRFWLANIVKEAPKVGTGTSGDVAKDVNGK